MKICSRCHIKKPLKSFDKQRIKGKLYYKPYCCGCKSKRHRLKHPVLGKEISQRGKKKYRANQMKTKLALMESIGQLKCFECGFSDIRALSFHHRKPEEKSFSISQGFTHCYSLQTLLEEVKKCDVLCMNCHTIKHCKNI